MAGVDMSTDEARAHQTGPSRFVNSVRRAHHAAVIRLAGELDLATTDELRERLIGAVESATATTIEIDMSEVSFIDARSVGVIVSAWKAAVARGRVLQVAGLRDLPERVFDVLGLTPTLVRRNPEENPGGEPDDRYGTAREAATRRHPIGGAHEAG